MWKNDNAVVIIKKNDLSDFDDVIFRNLFIIESGQ